jgi:hypothetical protein
MKAVPVAGCGALQNGTPVALAAVPESSLAEVNLGHSTLAPTSSIGRGTPVDRLPSVPTAAPLGGNEDVSPAAVEAPSASTLTGAPLTTPATILVMTPFAPGIEHRLSGWRPVRCTATA